MKYTLQYAQKHQGRMSGQQPHSNMFMFECQLQHKFMLSHKQVIQGKWCGSCSKTLQKMRKKLDREGLTLLSMRGGEKIAARLRLAMAPQLQGLADFFEREMLKERVDEEVRERRSLEKSFENWSRKTSTGGLEESKRGCVLMFMIVILN